MKEFWDERYAESDYAYGTEPNAYFKEALKRIKPAGKALFPAEGEGRNSVYAAKKGLTVMAFDYSRQAQIKALKLAKARNVHIDYLLGELNSLEFKPHTFDLLVFIFTHFSPGLNEVYYKKLAGSLKPGGHIIAEVFSKDHLQFSNTNPLAGGPKNIDMLFTADDFKGFYPEFRIIELSQNTIKLNEGSYHQGKANVIRYIGQKPNYKDGIPV